MGWPHTYVASRVNIALGFLNTRKKPIFSVSEQSKVYKYIPEEDLRGHTKQKVEITRRKPLESSQK
ncbi:UDP-glucuronosyltransferase 2B13 [Gossypium arboreum]|uniref:UDP-glucuronosyltransferase 2B13 n=1 Tax=Gossypium arboreum TaxID=29729 RepID=A0A0B0P4U5_GOSAR|nr:UDP-glucuronosyltransferase 2B13 [Gossypium arboreum]